MSRRARVATAAGAAAALALSGLVVSAAVGDAKPERVLQSVRVDLGADGTIYAIDGTNVRRVSGEKVSSDDADYDPGKDARDLPVRVLTSYRTADGSGTDLEDIKGYDGPVQVDITVQNTTLRPEKLSYDAADGATEQYALVGVPMTVTASADLGEDAVSEVVTRSDTGAAVTNGVLSQAKDGAATVQWAALLAPPSLSPTTTFTLVENARDFQMPELSIGVQPGLATDPSIQALISSAFSDSGQSQLKLESQTIEMVGEVTTVLAEAANQLNKVRSQLNYSADTLGDRTITSLLSGTQTVTSSTKALSSELTSLADSLDSALATTKSAALAELSASVDKVRALLGDTSVTPSAPRLDGHGCATKVLDAEGANTVYGQLIEVTTRLNGLASATDECADSIKAGLVRTIGTADAGGQAQGCATATSAICTIQGSAGAIGTVITGLADSLGKAKGDIDGTKAADAKQKVDALVTEVVALQALAVPLPGQAGNDTAAIKQAIKDVRDQVAGIRTDLDARHGDLVTALGELRQYAQDRRGDVGATADAKDSLREQLGTVAQQLCDLRSKPGVTLTDADIRQLRELTTGTDCDGNALNTGNTTPLAQRLGNQADAWQSVADRADASSSSDLADAVAQVHAFDTRLADVDTAIGAVLDQIDNGGLKGSLKDLVDAITALYDAGNADANAPLNQVVAAVEKVIGNQDKVKQKLDEDVAAFQAELTEQQAAVQAGIPVLDAQRQLSSKDVEQLFGSAREGLTTAGRTVQTKGKQSIDAQNAKLAGEQKQFAAVLDKAVLGAVRMIDTSVSSSTRDLGAAESLLMADLRAVLSDLGSRDRRGSGLLGVIEAQSAQTRTSTAALGSAYDTASGFGNVRGEDLGGVYLQQAQLARSLELLSALPAFGIELPEGSTHSTVYSFHMREIK